VDRIASTFNSIKTLNRTGLVAYITTGFPDLESTRNLIPALAKSGADIIELGVPFSDPLADGTVIQQSTNVALKLGITLNDCLDLIAQVREEVPNTPLILMGYYNPILSYGIHKFVGKCVEVGVDGLIVVDLPSEEIEPLQQECQGTGLHIIPLLAPTSDEHRIAQTVSDASGFIYCVSVTGVTGARSEVSTRGFDLLSRVRRHTQLPLAVGFGISQRSHVEQVCEQADAAVVGSALIKVMLDSPREDVVDNASRFISQLSGSTPEAN
jgi:tryptophan synthase alpha chain